MAKNKAKTDIELFNYLTTEKNFTKEWIPQKTKNPNIQEMLSKASKSEKGNKGSPDLIYLNEDKKLLILIENKDKINDQK